MKIFLKVSLVAIVLMFASCSDDDSIPEKVVENPIVGIWDLVSASAGTITVDIFGCASESYMLFTDNRFLDVSYRLKDNNCDLNTTSGLYVTKDGRLILSDEDSSQSINFKYSISGDELTLRSTEEGISVSAIFKRK